eukprot:223780-Chlamydomonas_euryale.AAC.7
MHRSVRPSMLHPSMHRSVRPSMLHPVSLEPDHDARASHGAVAPEGATMPHPGAPKPRLKKRTRLADQKQLVWFLADQKPVWFPVDVWSGGRPETTAQKPTGTTP